MRKILYKAAKYPFFGRFMVNWQNPLSEDDRKLWKEFEIRSHSSGLIRGMWRSSEERSVGTIVLGHPMGKEAKGLFLKNYENFYRRCGLNIIVFDFNGFGQSTHGNFSYFQDIIAVGHFARQRFGPLPLFYHGISMGGQWGIVAFAEEHVYDFAIIESAPPTLEEFWIKYPLAYGTLRFLTLLMPRFSKRIRMIDRVKELNNIKSLLLIYSETDEYTPASMGERFKANSNVPTELWTVKEAEHAKIYKSQHKDAYEKKIENFISTCVSNDNTERLNH